jgi:hypothetical protein
MERKNSIENFIGVFDNYITDIDCAQAINFYEGENKLEHTLSRMTFEGASNVEKKDNQFFADHHNIPIWVGTLKPLIYNFDQALNEYQKQTGIKEAYHVEHFKYTGLKIQKTLPGEGYHMWHIEHNPGFLHEGRAMAWLIFLNDVEEAGETEFLHQKIRVKPKKGRIVIWPAAFPFVHRGNPPLSGEKYILTSWMMLPKIST